MDMNHTLVTPDRCLDGDKCSIRCNLFVRAKAQLSYLKESCKRVRYSSTLPPSILTSIFTTSAMRRSRSVPEAVSTALFAASSQDFALVPITSVTLYTESADLPSLAIIFPFYFLLRFK